MTGKEGKLLLLKNFENKFNEFGFIQNKRRDTTTEFIKKNENGFDEFGIDIYTYSPQINFGFVVWKRIDAIENIIAEINKIVILDNSHNKNSHSLSFQKKGVELKIIYVQTEEDLVLGFNKIMDYFINEALPVLNSFNDIKNIDNTINGERDNFWETDNDNSKPFTFAHLFYARRLIIGRLVKNNIDFEEFTIKFYEMIDKKLANDNKLPLDRNDYNISTNIIVRYLKENLKPIY